MPPIQLSRAERASLRKIFGGPQLLGEIPAEHEEKFINYALIRKRVLLLYITPLGQIELTRHSFGNIRTMEQPKIRGKANAQLPPFRRNQLLTSRFHDSP